MSCGNKLRKKIKEITGKIDDAVREFATHALSITTNIKHILDSPVGNLLTKVIPGDWDDNLKEKATGALAKAIDALALTTDIVNEQDPEKKLKMFVYGLSDKSPEFRESQLKKTMDIITKYLDDAKLKDHEYEVATMGTFITAVK